MNTYVPPPAKSPWHRRSAPWLQGVPVAVLLLAAFLAVPAVYGGVLLVWELDAAIHGTAAPGR